MLSGIARQAPSGLNFAVAQPKNPAFPVSKPMTQIASPPVRSSHIAEELDELRKRGALR